MPITQSVCHLAVNRTGRYARLQLVDQSELNVAELKIFGSLLKNTSRKQIDSPENENIVFFVYPNPSMNEVNIEFYLNSEARGSISIFDIMGREQKQFENDLFYAGKNMFTWDGSDAEGERSSAGIYIIRLIIDDVVY